MRKRRILSLLLAVAVMATMLVAVPLTASAAGTSENTHYAEWFFTGSDLKIDTSQKTDNLNNYREISTNLQNNLDGSTPSLSALFDSKGGAWATQGNNKRAFTSWHKTHDTTSATVLKTSNNGSRGLILDTAFNAEKYDSYDLGILIYNTGASAANATINVKNAEGSGEQLNAGNDSFNTPPNTGSPEYYTLKGLTTPKINIIITGTQCMVEAVSVDYNLISTDPKITLSKDNLTLCVGDSETITATVKNLADTETVKWESDHPSIASVQGGVITGEAKGEAKITATASDNKTKAECKVIVKDTKTLTIDAGLGNKVELKQDGVTKYTSDPKNKNIGFEEVPYGTYDVVLTNVATTTYTNFQQTQPPQITVGKGSPTSYTVGSSEVKKGVDFTNEVYNALVGNAITWGFDGGSKPASFNYITLAKKAADGTTPIAGSAKGENEDADSKVYLLANTTHNEDDAKIDCVGRSNDFQINTYASLKIPVTVGSKITVENYSNNGNDHNAEYTLGAHDKTTDKTVTYTPSSEEIQQGYVELNVTKGNYLSYIKVETPAIFGTTTDTDSGYYTESGEQAASNDQKLGVIRFFQSFAGSTEVAEYGFYFIDSENGEINNSFRAFEQGNIEYDTVEGMYGDFMGIKNEDFGTDFYAKPYVKISGVSEPIYGAAIKGSVGDNPKWVDKPDSAQ